jgi:hypothetical protein
MDADIGALHVLLDSIVSLEMAVLSTRVEELEKDHKTKEK